MKTLPRHLIVAPLLTLGILLATGAAFLGLESRRDRTLTALISTERQLVEATVATGAAPDASLRELTDRSHALRRAAERDATGIRLLLIIGLAGGMFVVATTVLFAHRLIRRHMDSRAEAEASVRLLGAIIASMRERIDVIDGTGNPLELPDWKATPLDSGTGSAHSDASSGRTGESASGSATGRPESDGLPRISAVFLPHDDSVLAQARRDAAAWRGIDEVLSGRSEEFQLEYQLGTGEDERWKLMRVTRLDTSSAEDAGARVVVTHEDITARVLIARALRAGEERYRTVVASMEDLVFVLDDRLRWIGIYGQAAERTGFGEGCAGRPMGSILSSDTALHEGMALRALEGGHSVYEWTWPVGVGERRIETAMSPVRDDSGTVVGVVGVGRDVTARAAREQQIRRRAAILGAVGDASTHFLRSVDWRDSIPTVLEHLGTAVEASRIYVAEYRQEDPNGFTTRQRHEWTAEGIAPRTAGPSFQDASWRAEAFADWRAALARGETVGGVVRRMPSAIRTILSEQGTLSLLLIPIFVGDERVGLLGIEDCEHERVWSDTEIDALRAAADTLGAAIDRGRIEDALHESEEQLKQAQKMEAIGRLAGGIAHDFNNLLTAITGRTELLLADPRPAASITDDLEEIRKAAERAATLTRQLLAFSRRQVLEPRVVDLNDVVRDVESMLRRMIGEDIILVTRLEPELGPTRADPNHIVQVLMNLVVNARDAMSEGGSILIETANETLGARTAASLEIEPGEYVRLSVKDDGRGIPTELREKIFDPFFTTKDAGKGTGLGLSTVYGIVKQSGGHVGVQSEEGEGATFRILLPRAGAEGAPSAAATDRPLRRVETDSGTETVLLVEDEAAVRTLVRRVLERSGYRVLEATNGAEAIQLAGHFDGEIDLLLTDVVMPGLGGGKVAEAITSTRPDVRVLFMSGYTDEEVVHERFIAAGSGFLSKPFTPDTLARKVREILDGPGREGGATP